MKFQILINHYKESLEILERFLFSVDSQIVNNDSLVEIIVCTDGTDHKIDNFNLTIFHYPIYYFARPHRGVCATRNALLDISDADYVMFCDCDDMFSKNSGLQALISAAEKTNADVIGSDYNIEYKNTEGFFYEIAHRNVSRVHGKIFKRSYLLEQNIRFPDDMSFSGDMYFLYLAYHLTDSIAWLPDNFYVWKWMPVSVTRGKDHYSVRTYDRVLYCYTLVLRELKRRERSDLVIPLINTMTNKAYIDWHSNKFLEAPDELRHTAKLAIVEFLKEFCVEYYLIPESQRKQNYIQRLIHGRTYGPPEKFVGLEKWIQDLLDGNN